jgi:hypothetical protein
VIHAERTASLIKVSIFGRSVAVFVIAETF